LVCDKRVDRAGWMEVKNNGAGGGEEQIGGDKRKRKQYLGGVIVNGEGKEVSAWGGWGGGRVWGKRVVKWRTRG